MKIRLTLEVSDLARLHMGALDRTAPVIKGGRPLVRREAVVAHLQLYLDRLTDEFAAIPRGPLTAEESIDAQDAIDYLRKLGKTDPQIRAWLLLQRARLHFGKPIDTEGGP
jgi:hypothetical protein